MVQETLFWEYDKYTLNISFWNIAGGVEFVFFNRVYEQICFGRLRYCKWNIRSIIDFSWNICIGFVFLFLVFDLWFNFLLIMVLSCCRSFDHLKWILMTNEILEMQICIFCSYMFVSMIKIWKFVLFVFYHP